MRLWKSVKILWLSMGVYSGLGLAEEKKPAVNQEAIIEYLKADTQIIPAYNFIRRSAFMSTVLSNMYKFSPTTAATYGFKEYIIENEEGFKRKTYIRLAKDKRPTVMIVGGLGSSTTMQAFHNFAIPLAEEQGWGVILAENTSSPEWIDRNHAVQISGYQSGWDLYLFTKVMRTDVRFAPYIAELHTVGLSLGGSDSAFASYFDSKLKTQFLDGGIMAWSSPADRLETMKVVRVKTGFGGWIIKRILSRIYYGTAHVLREITQRDLDWLKNKGDFDELLADVYQIPALQYFQKHPHHFERTLDGDSKISVDSIEDLKELKNFADLFQLSKYWKQLSKPILWVHAEDDPIVDFDLTQNYINGQKSNQYVGIFASQQGGHLGQPTVYGDAWVKNVIVQYSKYWGKLPMADYDHWKRP